MAGVTIATDVTAIAPMSFAKSRAGQLIGVTGLQRGKVWNGQGQMKELGIDPPTEPPEVVAVGSGNSIAGDYYCAYRYVDEGLNGNTYSSLSPLVKVTATENSAFQWNSYQQSSQDRVTKVEFFRGLPEATGAVPNTLYRIQASASSGNILSMSFGGGNMILLVESGHNLTVGSTITVEGSPSYDGPYEILEVTGSNYIVLDTPYVGPAALTTWTLVNAKLDTLSDSELLAAALTAGEDFVVVVNPDGSLNARRFVPPPEDRPFVFQYQDRMWYWGSATLTKGRVNVTFSPYGESQIPREYGVASSNGVVVGVGVNWTTELVGRKILIEGDLRARDIIGVNEEFNYLTIDSNLSTTAGENLRYTIYSPGRSRQAQFSEIDEPESCPEINVVTVQENTGDDDHETGAMVRGGFAYLLMQRHKYRLSYVAQATIDASINQVDDRGALNNSCWDYYENVAYMMDENGPYVFDGRQSSPIDQAIRDLWRDGTIDLSKRDTFHVVVDRLRDMAMFFVAFTGDSGEGPKNALVYNTRRKTWDIYQYPVDIGDAVRATVDGTSRTLLCAEDDVTYLSDEGHVDLIGETETPIAWTWKSRRWEFPTTEDQISHGLRIVFTPTEADGTIVGQVWYDHDTEPATFIPINLARWGVITEGNPDRLEFLIGRNSLEGQDNRGIAEIDLADRHEPRGTGHRFIVFELSGTQSGEEIVIEEIELKGVE